MMIEQYGARLQFEVTERRAYETLFIARYQGEGFAGEVSSSASHVDSLASLFRHMADNWQGWTGAVEWRDMDGMLELSASSDSTGHAKLDIIMLRYGFQPEVSRRLAVQMVLDAGTLEQIATDLEAMFL